MATPRDRPGLARVPPAPRDAQAASTPPPRILILSAGVGRGHHAAAEGLREEFARVAPDTQVAVRNGIGRPRGAPRLLLERCMRWQLMRLPRAYSVSYAISVRWSFGRRVAVRLLHSNTHRWLAELIAAERPDVVVSTYPGITATLGVMRQRGTLATPVCALITDIAGLHFWAHPGVDLHAVTFGESLAEVAEISRGGAAHEVRPPLTASHLTPTDRHRARLSLGLDPDTPLIVVSGGGWGVGDLEGAISAGLEVPETQVIVVCGENVGARARLARHYATQVRVRVLGDTGSMAELLAAATALVHSTGGVTFHEAAAHGCPVIAYGFGFGHMRENVAAMSRLGIVRAAATRTDLVRALREVIGSAPTAPPGERRGHVSSLILGLIAPHRLGDPGHLAAGGTPPWGAGDGATRGAREARITPVVLLLAALLAVWLLWRPPSPDLAAQVYRAHLFSVVGFSIWDNGWYGGHYLPGYSLIFPPLASLLGVHWLGIIAVSFSMLLFGRLAIRLDGFRARPATLLFTLSAAGDLFIGRVTFALGVTFGLASVLAAARGSRVTSGLSSLACAAASPVAAAFLVLAACADLWANRAFLRAAAIGVPSLSIVLALLVLFPEGGYEPFAFSSLLAAAAATGALVVLLDPADRLLRRAGCLYLVGLVLAYVVHSPMGGNAVRLGVLFVPAALAGRVGVADVQRVVLHARAARGASRRGPRAPAGIGQTPARWLLGLSAAAVLLWQLTGPIDQSVGAALDPAAHYRFYVPALTYLASLPDSSTMRIEVPFTSSHWDATILGRRFLLARGWERQLDTRYDALFYAPSLTASAYHAWLLDNAVSIVALSSAPPDFSSIQEDALIRGGLPFLRLVFSSPNWQIYAVQGAQPLASGPGRLTAVDSDGFTLDVTRPGRFVVRLHYTRYWTAATPAATVGPAPGGWTSVVVARPGTVAIDAAFHL